MTVPKRTYLTVLILQILEEEGEVYGYRLCEIIRGRAENEESSEAGTVYPLLHILEEAGLVEGERREILEGRERYYFRLTERGKRTLNPPPSRPGERFRSFIRTIVAKVFGKTMQSSAELHQENQ